MQHCPKFVVGALGDLQIPERSEQLLSAFYGFDKREAAGAEVHSDRENEAGGLG